MNSTSRLRFLARALLALCSLAGGANLERGMESHDQAPIAQQDVVERTEGGE